MVLKKIIISISLLMFAICGYSQVFNIGPKAGLNYSKIIFDEKFRTDAGEDFSLKTQDGKVGVAFGGFLRFSGRRFYFQPEVLFTQDKSEIELRSVTWDEIRRIRINKLDIPVMVGLKFGNGGFLFRMQGGPVFSKVMHSSYYSSVTEVWEDTQNYEDFSIGYQAGLGFDIKRFTLDLKYEGSLSKLGYGVQVGSKEFEFDHRKSIYQTTIGFKFVKPKSN